MSKFKVGDDAVVFSPDDYIHNEECVVVGELRRRAWNGSGLLEGQSGVDDVYEIDIRGEIFYVFPWELRKKKPPEEASWEEIQKSTGWSPSEKERQRALSEVS